MNKVLLDASALLALINNETGADIIESLIGNIIISSVNVTEVASKLCDIVGNIKEDDQHRLQTIREMAIEPFVRSVISFDQELAYIAAGLRAQTKHKGLSLGDRACLATAIKLSLPVYTADKIWQQLNIPNLEIKVIR